MLSLLFEGTARGSNVIRRSPDKISIQRNGDKYRRLQYNYPTNRSWTAIQPTNGFIDVRSALSRISLRLFYGRSAERLQLGDQCPHLVVDGLGLGHFSGIGSGSGIDRIEFSSQFLTGQVDTLDVVVRHARVRRHRLLGQRQRVVLDRRRFFMDVFQLACGDQLRDLGIVRIDLLHRRSERCRGLKGFGLLALLCLFGIQAGVTGGEGDGSEQGRGHQGLIQHHVLHQVVPVSCWTCLVVLSCASRVYQFQRIRDGTPCALAAYHQKDCVICERDLCGKVPSMPPTLLPVRLDERRINDVIRYLRRSLLDTLRLGPEARAVAAALKGHNSIAKNPRGKGDGANIVIMSMEEFLDGQLMASTQEAIATAVSTPENKKARTGTSVASDPIRLAILPWIGIPTFDHGSKHSGSSACCLPICLQADLLPDGTLMPVGELPWFARDWLEGTVGDELPFGDALQVDRFQETRTAESVTDWEEMIESVDDLCSFVAGMTLTDLRHPAYVRYQGVAVIVGDTTGGATFHILPVYDGLLKATKIPPLLAALLQDVPKPVEDIPCPAQFADLDKLHVGQMRGDFGLAERQREAIRCHLNGVSSEILAINGPPGTGKTTFIQTVVATEFTRSALDKKTYPPIIVAASSNNRAVTNILDTFRDAAAASPGSNALASRWIPDIHSYGVYCPSTDNRRNALSGMYPYRQTGSDPLLTTFTATGLEVNIEDDGAIAAATGTYLSHCSVYAGRVITSIPEAIALLHGHLEARVEGIREVLGHHVRAHTVLHGSAPEFGTPIELEVAVATAAQRRDDSIQAFLAHAETTAAWCGHVDARPWWERVLSLIGFRRSHLARANQSFCDLRGLQPGGSTDDKTIEGHLAQVRADLEWSRAVAITEHAALAERFAAFASAVKHLTSSLAAIGCDSALASKATYSTPTASTDIAGALDCGPRHVAFLFSVHYWEGRWLQQVVQDRKEKKPPSAARYAMLFPCSVCTFYMLPKVGFFPTGDGIDLLIVDEAGQAPLVIAAASFARAKRALVVGDIDQIEPVWTLPRHVDEANLRDANLLNNDQSYEWWWNKGRCTAHGNLMRLAQDASRYHPFAAKNLSRGLYLTEHRRCREPIIRYCNDLVYGGVLESKRPSDPAPLMPPMWLIDVPVELSTSKDGSRCNELEAQTIVDWISQWREKILERFPVTNCRSGVPLASRVAVITPFKVQARLINQLMEERGLPKITIGTVHSLQGAECEVVIFSSVYGGRDRVGTLFYDRTPNLLNVAVSRAKEHFVVFADIRIFGRSPGTPSEILRRMMSRSALALT